MSDISPSGLHHVTAIASDPQRNVDFYTRVLGLRLVKQTVNFDDPGTYHLYYGDSTGRPSTILTFFPWQGVPAGRNGAGLTTATAFSVPPESLGWWQRHLTDLQVDADRPVDRDGEAALRSGWDGAGRVPAEHAVRGLHSVTMSETALEPTGGMLAGLLNMRTSTESADRARFTMGGGEGAVVDVSTRTRGRGLQAGGTVHHIAFRVPDGATQARWRAELVDAGVKVTEIIDRRYFTSVYFREPGGVLLEIATDRPGFTVDEPLLELGRELKLPPWLEPDREQIAAALPPLRLPDAGGTQ